MAKFSKAWSKDVEDVTNKAVEVAKEWNANVVNTVFVFLAVSSVLNAKSKTPRYQSTWSLYKETLNSFGVTSKSIGSKLQSYLDGLPKDTDDFRYVKEAIDVFDTLTNYAVDTSEPAEMEDLIRVLFSDYEFDLCKLLSEVTGSRTKTIELYEAMSSAFKKSHNNSIPALESNPLLTNLNAYVAEKKPNIIGAEQAVKQIELALMGKSIRNAILVGLAGTGKTASVYEFARMLNEGSISQELKGKVVYQLEPAALVAGTRFRGDFEERMMNLIQSFVAEPNAILFIDEAHQMLKLGDAEGASNAANILKPFITRGDVQMIWATTNEEYNQTIAKDKALARRFHQVNIPEPTPAQTLQILQGILPGLEAHYNRTAPEGLLPTIIEMADKYNIEQANPAKSINLLELSFANSKVFNEASEVVNDQDLIQSIQLKYGISVSKTKTKDTITELNGFLLGQEEPLAKVGENLKYIEKGFVDSGKPLISMLFAGPTGVGKTETAKIIAKYFCGSENYLIKINMGEFTNQSDISKLIGSPIGYIGSDSQPGLIRSIRQYPNSVVLFDEAEKAHPSIFDAVLSILDTGEMADNYGNRVSFRSAIIILTSNLGYSGEYANPEVVASFNSENERVKDAIVSHFRPEFINRLDDIIYFNRLSSKVADLLIERYRKQYVEMIENITQDHTFSMKDISDILAMANIHEYGARGLKRAVRKQLLILIERREGPRRATLAAKQL